MTEHNLLYYPYASFTDAQLPLLKVAALWFDKLVILDPVGASRDTIAVGAGASLTILQRRAFLLSQDRCQHAAASVITNKMRR